MLKNIIHNTTFTRNVALPGIIVLVLLSLLSALFPLRVNNWLTFVQSFIYKNLSWMYILLVSFFVIFLLAVAFSKLGNIRLGADNSEPQYGFFSWIAMLFAAGMGIGLMYFGVSEPMSHYMAYSQKFSRARTARSPLSSPCHTCRYATSGMA